MVSGTIVTSRNSARKVKLLIAHEKSSCYCLERTLDILSFRAKGAVMQKNFAYRDLTEYDFSGVDLRGADFSHAILRQADFRRARLEQADVSYAGLEGAHFVEDFYLKASALSPDGTLLATDLHDHKHHDDGIRLWNVASGQIERERIGHLLSVTCLDFHPRGHLLAGGNAGGLIRLWDVEQGQLVREMQTSPAYSVRRLAFHPNGKWLIAGNESISVLAGQQPVIHILDIEKGELVGRFPGGVHTLACQRTGELLARTDGGRTIEVWKFTRWRRISTVSVPHFVHGQITSLAFHPTQSTWLYVHLRAEQFSTIILLDLASGTMLSSLRGSSKGAQPGESAIEPSRMVPLAQENQLAVVGGETPLPMSRSGISLKKNACAPFKTVAAITPVSLLMKWKASWWSLLIPGLLP